MIPPEASEKVIDIHTLKQCSLVLFFPLYHPRVRKWDFCFSKNHMNTNSHHTSAKMDNPVFPQAHRYFQPLCFHNCYEKKVEGDSSWFSHALHPKHFRMKFNFIHRCNKFQLTINCTLELFFLISFHAPTMLPGLTHPLKDRLAVISSSCNYIKFLTPRELHYKIPCLRNLPVPIV